MQARIDRFKARRARQKAATAAAAGVSLLEADGDHEDVRGHHRARQVSLDVEPGEIVGLIGPERRGQDDVLQLPARHAETRSRARCASTASISPGADAPAGAARHRAHVPAHRAVRRHDAARAPARRRARPARRRRALEGPARPGPAEGRRARAGRRDDRAARARRRRRPPDRVAQPRPRPAGRGRPRADDAAAAPAARRAVVGPRPSRDRRARATRCATCNEQRGTAILLVEHDVEIVRSLVDACVRARLRHADRERDRPPRCSPTRPCRRAYLGDVV